MKSKQRLLIFILWMSGMNLPVQSASAPSDEAWVTVFVHGIMSIKPHISFSNFLRFMTDDINNTVYSKTVEIMRNDPIFYQNQAMQGIGLKKLDPTQLKKGNASNSLAYVYDEISHFVCPQSTVKNYYYTFGWTGLLSPTHRYLDAVKLYNALAQEVARIKQHHTSVRLRIIGYSHGGNICLNLALARQQAATQLEVDELILLGMPVQTETDYLINDPMFKKIYHIYSRGDRIQKLDFFSFDRFFSRRIFKKRRDFTLPDKLIQIQLKCTRNTILRTQRNRTCPPYGFKHKSMVGGKSNLLRDASPGHTELWFFGWTPANYRPTFPLNPFPVVAFVPLILQCVEFFQEKSLFEKPTLIDMRPEHGIILIKNQKYHRVLTVTPFLPPELFAKLENKVLEYAPDIYTDELYMGRIRAAYVLAYQLHHEEWLTIRRKRRKRAATCYVDNDCHKVKKSCMESC